MFLKMSSFSARAPHHLCKQTPIRHSIISLFITDFGWTGAPAGF
jgi:hypothetical protein